MDAISYTAARANLAKTMDRVSEDHEPIIITRQSGEPAVLMSLADFTAWQETTYLMRSPANAKRLLAAVEQVAKGRTKTRKLVPRP
jgi:antitoxin YefM